MELQKYSVCKCFVQLTCCTCLNNGPFKEPVVCQATQRIYRYGWRRAAHVPWFARPPLVSGWSGQMAAPAKVFEGRQRQAGPLPAEQACKWHAHATQRVVHVVCIYIYTYIYMSMHKCVYIYTYDFKCDHIYMAINQQIYKQYIYIYIYIYVEKFV